MTKEEEIETLATRYAGPGFRERRDVKHEPYCQYGQGSWTLDQFIEVFQDLRAKIPKTARNIFVELEGDYDENTKLSVTYWDLEPEASQQERIEKSVAYAKEKLMSEREQYEKLKAKFEPSR